MEQFHKNVSQHKITKTLKIAHLQYSENEEGASVHQGQGQRWFSEYFQKSLCVNTVHSAVPNCKFKQYHAEEEAMYEYNPETLQSTLGQSSSKMV